MNPGRELDALIAEKVMGWKPFDGEPPGAWIDEQSKAWAKSVCIKESYDRIPPYSTDIAAAWEIVRHLSAEWKLYLKSDFTKPREWVQGCTFSCNQLAKVTLLHFKNGMTVEAESNIGLVLESVPHAVCLAALKTVGVDLPDNTV